MAVQQYVQTNPFFNLSSTFCPGAAGGLFGPAHPYPTAGACYGYFHAPDCFTYFNRAPGRDPGPNFACFNKPGHKYARSNGHKYRPGSADRFANTNLAPDPYPGTRGYADAFADHSGLPGDAFTGGPVPANPPDRRYFDDRGA